MVYVRCNGNPHGRAHKLITAQRRKPGAPLHDQNRIATIFITCRTILSMISFRSSIAKRHSSSQQKALGLRPPEKQCGRTIARRGKLGCVLRWPAFRMHGSRMPATSTMPSSQQYAMGRVQKAASVFYRSRPEFSYIRTESDAPWVSIVRRCRAIARR